MFAAQLRCYTHRKGWTPFFDPSNPGIRPAGEMARLIFAEYLANVLAHHQPRDKT